MLSTHEKTAHQLNWRIIKMPKSSPFENKVRSKFILVLSCTLAFSTYFTGMHTSWSRPQSLQEQLRTSLGVRFSKAKNIASKGKLKQATQLLEQTLKEVENGLGAIPIRSQLAQWYIKMGQIQKAKRVLRIENGPAKRALRALYTKLFHKFLHIRIEARLQTKKRTGKVSTQIKRYTFTISRTANIRKHFPLRMGRIRAHATTYYRYDKGIKVIAYLNEGEKKAYFTMRLFENAAAQKHEQQSSLKETQINATKLRIRIFAKWSHIHKAGIPWSFPTPPNSPGKKNRYNSHFTMQFKKAPLPLIFKHLARLNGYKVTYKDPRIKTRTLTLKIKAKLRKDLLLEACKRSGVLCSIQGKTLRVSLPLATPKTPKTPQTPTPLKRTQNTASSKKKFFSIRMKQVSLQTAFRQLARWGGYQISFPSPTLRKRTLSLRLNTQITDAFLVGLCKKMHVHCTIKNKHLHVSEFK